MAEPLSLDALNTFGRLIDIGDILERHCDLDTRTRTGMSWLQYDILLRLRNNGGQLRMSELAGILVQSPSTLTYQIRVLESFGYAVRERDSSDDRAVLAKLTQAGLEFTRSQVQVVAGLIHEWVAAPLTERELSQLAKLLGKLQLSLRGEMFVAVHPDEAERNLPAVLPVGKPSAKRPEGPSPAGRHDDDRPATRR